MGSSQSQQCGVCEKTILGIFADDRIIPCERCGCVYCLDCAGITNAEYDHIQDSDGAVNWYCQFCMIEIKRNYDVIE